MQKFGSFKRPLFFLIFSSFILISCAEKEFDPADPAGSFAIAREPYDDKNWEIATRRLSEFKSRFPYSRFAAQAELMIADAQYELENYEEANVAYDQFVKLHPKHEKVDYAMYRIGETFWVQAPEEEDREQEYTQKAIVEWEKLIAQTPDSPYAAKAKASIEAGRERIARSFEFIAKFYCKQEIYHACAFRAELLADRFPQYKDLQKAAYLMASESLEKLSTQKAEDQKSDKNLYFKALSPAELLAKSKEMKKKADEIR
jgi:outer membrane protein assembly factor BamD